MTVNSSNFNIGKLESLNPSVNEIEDPVLHSAIPDPREFIDDVFVKIVVFPIQYVARDWLARSKERELCLFACLVDYSSNF